MKNLATLADDLPEEEEMTPPEEAEEEIEP